MNNMLLNSLISYFKVEISNLTEAIDNGLIINFENGKQVIIKIKNI